MPAAWQCPTSYDWHWMLTQRPVEMTRRGDGRAVEDLDERRDSVEIDDLLDEANPDSFARPGVPGIAAWLGTREHGGSSRLLAAGALQQMHDGTLHLRGVSVRPELRGSGAGTMLSAALTNHALGHGRGSPPWASTANTGALRLFDRLGYQVRHTFTSGEVAP